ncbi:hypothetical protein M0802_008180 [Mischocyttarus mexicanus]|nr:hypothetical protein M0802_008180 [Mischocyttarus mexicanus]
MWLPFLYAILVIIATVRGENDMFTTDLSKEEPTTVTTTTAEPTTVTTTTTEPTTVTTNSTEPTTVTTNSTEPTTVTTNSTEPTTVTTNSTEPTTVTTNSTEPTTETPTETTIPSSINEYPHKVSVNGKICIASRMKVSITVWYNNTENKIVNQVLPVPSTAETAGECDTTTSIMTLTWPISEDTPSQRIAYNSEIDDNSVTFFFKKDDSSFWINQIVVNITLDKKTFPGVPENQPKFIQSTNSDQKLFSAAATSGKYVCNVPTFIETENMELSISDVDLIAFIEDNDISSRSEENCEVTTANVGAIVGGVIGAVAVIGIIAFIIWRRKRNTTARSEVA